MQRQRAGAHKDAKEMKGNKNGAAADSPRRCGMTGERGRSGALQRDTLVSSTRVDRGLLCRRFARVLATPCISAHIPDPYAAPGHVFGANRPPRDQYIQVAPRARVDQSLLPPYATAQDLPLELVGGPGGTRGEGGGTRHAGESHDTEAEHRWGEGRPNS